MLIEAKIFDSGASQQVPSMVNRKAMFRRDSQSGWNINKAYQPRLPANIQE